MRATPARRRSTRLVTVVLAGLAAAVIGYWAATAFAASADCDVYASGGFANCLSYGSPSVEGVQARHAAGLSYKTQFWRPSDGAVWGPWTISNLNPQTFSFNLSGTITLQVDNLGTGAPSRYSTSMS